MIKKEERERKKVVGKVVGGEKELKIILFWLSTTALLCCYDAVGSGGVLMLCSWGEWIFSFYKTAAPTSTGEERWSLTEKLCEFSPVISLAASKEIYEL